MQALCQGDNVGLRNAALDVLGGARRRGGACAHRALPTAPENARKFVVEALGEAGGPLVVFELEQAALSSDVNLAGEAIEALARIGGPEAEARDSFAPVAPAIRSCAWPHSRRSTGATR